MENQTIQNERPTNVKNIPDSTETGVLFSKKEAEEFREYKRRKKEEEIMAAISRSEASLMQSEEVQRACERAIRLKQIAVKMPISKLLRARKRLSGSKVKTDCVIGGDGETLFRVKAYEARLALRRRAQELTFCLTPSLVAECRYYELRKEIRYLKRASGRATFKVWVDKKFPLSTISRVARIASEEGAKFFCIPYFEGCEKLRFDVLNGCKLEISNVENYEDFRKMIGAGMGRIVTSNAWDIHTRWLGEVEQELKNVATKPAVMPIEQGKMLEKEEKTTENVEKMQKEEEKTPSKATGYPLSDQTDLKIS